MPDSVENDLMAAKRAKILNDTMRGLYLAMTRADLNDEIIKRDDLLMRLHHRMINTLREYERIGNQAAVEAIRVYTDEIEAHLHLINFQPRDVMGEVASR